MEKPVFHGLLCWSVLGDTTRTQKISQWVVHTTIDPLARDLVDHSDLLYFLVGAVLGCPNWSFATTQYSLGRCPFFVRKDPCQCAWLQCVLHVSDHHACQGARVGTRWFLHHSCRLEHHQNWATNLVGGDQRTRDIFIGHLQHRSWWLAISSSDFGIFAQNPI